MIPSVASPNIAPKPAAPAVPPTANKTTAPPAPEIPRSSTGEAAAGNLRAETARAVDAPEQTAVAPRLRDQETSEQRERLPSDRDGPTGPPPAFEESPLERQARIALDPPERDVAAASVESPAADPESETGREGTATFGTDEFAVDPPPTPRERAEASFQETLTISAQPDNRSLDLSR